LQERCLDRRNCLFDHLIGANLESSKLLEHFAERQRHFGLVGRVDLSGEKVRRLLIDRAQMNARVPARHAALELGSAEQDPLVRINRGRFQQPLRQMRRDVGQLERDGTLSCRPLRASRRAGFGCQIA